MKIFKNKFFIIVLSIAVFIVILTATLSAMGQTDPIKNTLNSLTLPIRYVGIKIDEAMDGFFAYFSDIDKLREENASLKEDIDELENKLADANAVKEENDRLREYLDFKDQHPGLSFTEALIIGRESNNYMTLFTLNKGSLDGIKVGMPVVVSAGLVGSVSEVGESWCCVRTVNEASASVGAYISRSGEIGVIEGDISFKGSGSCYLNYLSADADVQVGDAVYTSGIGSVYPRDIYIGTVTEIRTNEYLRTKVAVVNMAVNVEGLKYVMIVTQTSDNGDQS